MLAVLDRAPMGWAQYRYWVLSTGGTLLGGFSVFTLGVALPLLMQTFSIDATMQGLLGAALLFGAVPGSALGGPLADRFGRKPLMILDMALVALGALICFLAGDTTVLLIGLFIFGIGVGIDYPVGSAFVAEWMPTAARSRMMVATITFQAVGFVLAAGLTASVLWLVEDAAAWRGFMLVLAALPLLILVLRVPLKESPRWLMGKGRNLDAARAIGAVVVAERARVEALGRKAGNAVHLVARSPEQVRSQGMAALFQRPYLRRTALACVPWFLMDIASYGIGLFTPLLLAELHFGKSGGGPIAADFSDISGTSVIDLFLLVGFLIAFWAVPRYGHIRPQVVGFLGMAVGMVVLVATLSTGGTAGPGAVAVFLGFVLFNLAMNIGPHSTTFALPAELFPTQLRGAGSGFASASAKVGAALGAFLLPIVRADFGLEAVLILVAVVSLAGALVTALLVEELGGAASLEDRHGEAIASKPDDGKPKLKSV